MPAHSLAPPATAVPQHSRLLLGGVAAAALILAVTAWLTLAELYAQAENRAVLGTQNVASSLEQTFNGLIDTIDIALRASAKDIGRQLSSGKTDARAITAMLVEQRDRIPYVAHFRATDAAGNIIYGPGIPTPPANIADREHFAHLRGDPERARVDARPFLGRTGGKWAWTFARRIDTADGAFGGIVFAAVSTEAIEAMFGEIKMLPGSAISLRDAQYRFIARYPPAEAADFPIGEKRLSAALLEALKRNPEAATYGVDAASIDGTKRIHSYRRNGKYGFLVDVGVDYASAFAEWRQQAKIVGGLVAASILALLVFLRLIRRAWRRQEEVAASLLEAQRIVHLGHYHYDLKTLAWTSSEIFDEIVGIDRKSQRDSRRWIELASPDEREARELPLSTVIERGIPFDREYRIIRPCDGQERWVHSKAKLQFAADGSPAALIGTLQDITERKQAEADLRVAAVAFESQQAMMITDRNAIILRVNRAFTEITGYTAEEAVGRNPSLLKSGRHDAAFFRALWESIARTGNWQGEIWDKRKNGEEYPLWLTISTVRNGSGEVTHYVGAQYDITERKNAEEKINELAFYDPLTALPNRTLLLDRLRQIMTASLRNNRYCALLLIDLDHFKTLNDTLGHDMGDLLLQQVAQRLTACVRADDTVARLGGDEFVVVLTNLATEKSEAATHTELVGEKILAALNRNYALREVTHHSTPSIGATLFVGQQIEIESLLKQADLAMYRSKEEGRNALRFFDPDMERVVMKRAALEKDLRVAIEENQFELHYQPQISGGALTGVEALVRWRNPQRGLVSPAEFIPLAEETGLILALGLWVMETACRQLAAWAALPEKAELTIAVNVNAHQLRQPDFVDRVISVLDKTGANPRRLKLELTESMLVSNVEEVIEKMFALRFLGVGFSLDDFGTGYSSLSYLKRLPLDQLKIDQSFVRDVLVDPNDAAIAKTVIALAQSLGLAVIAEGVETEAQRDFLATAGCLSYQGYFFSRPLPLNEFEKYAQRGFSAAQDPELARLR